MSLRLKLVSNTVYLFSDWFFTSLLSMFYWFIIGKLLLPSHYGIIATSTQIVMALSGISLLGLGGAIRKLIPEWSKKRESEKIRGMIRYSSKIILISSITIAIILILFSQKLGLILNLESRVIIIIAFSIIAVTFTGLFGSVHYGLQNMRRYFLTNLYGQIVKVIIVLPLIFLGLTYFGPLIAFFTCFIVISLSRFEKKFFKDKKININKKIISKYSTPAFIVNILLVLLNYTHYIILTLLIAGNLSSSETMSRVGYFAIAMTISFPIQIIPNILSSALFPIISELSVDKKKERKQAYLIKLIFRYSLFFVLPLAVFLILTSNHVIIFFSKLEYLPANEILPFLIIASMFYGLGNIFLSSLYALRKPQKYRNCYLGIVTLYLVLSVPLTYYLFEKGLAVSYLISMFFLLFSGGFLIKKYLKVEFPIEDAGRIIFATFLSSVFLLLFKQFIPNIWIAVIFVVIASLIYLLILLLTGFYIGEDLKVLDFLVKKSPIFKENIVSFKKFLSKRVSRSYLKTT
jgi:O-antigen/teichoic acid export membrane protein